MASEKRAATYVARLAGPQRSGGMAVRESDSKATAFGIRRIILAFLTKVPDATFKTRVRNDALEGDNPFEWKDLTTSDIFKGRKVIVFSLPGAFTPTCSTSHLPRYEELDDEFKALGVDQTVCISVNDAYVMYQWGRSQKVDKVFLLPDGNGEFTRKMGMLVEKSDLGFGMRSWRYAMVVDDCEIAQMFVEKGYSDNCPTDPFEVSDADTVLNWLKK